MRYIILFGFFSLILAMAFKLNTKELLEKKKQDDKEYLHAILSEMATIDAEIKPLPTLGYDHLKDYVKLNLIYPEPAIENQIEGNVYLQLIIGTDGSLKDVKTIKGIGFGCDEEAERLLKESSIKWNPGYKDDKPVETKMVLAILFRLNS
jgi:hypothetical protein